MPGPELGPHEPCAGLTPHRQVGMVPVPIRQLRLGSGDKPRLDSTLGSLPGLETVFLAGRWTALGLCCHL